VAEVNAQSSPREAAREKAVRIREFREMVRARHPRFIEAVLADARITSRNRGRPLSRASRSRVALEALRLAWESDGFLAQALYRAKAGLQGRGVPILPRILHRLAIATSGIYIGDPVVVHPGVHLAHGQIVIDGIAEVHSGAQIFPFVTIGLRAPSMIGPTIGPRATIGSGAKVLGEVEIGEAAKVGANAVVLADVPDGATVVGVPARPAERTVGADSAADAGD
jgi:serine O-acetyltransferase